MEPSGSFRSGPIFTWQMFRGGHTAANNNGTGRKNANTGSEDETDELSAETEEITDVVDGSRVKSVETSAELGVNQVEK